MNSVIFPSFPRGVGYKYVGWSSMKILLFSFCCILALIVGCNEEVVEPSHPRPSRNVLTTQVAEATPVVQDRLNVFIHKNKMHVELDGAAQPVTLQTLKDHGVIVNELQTSFFDIMRIIGSDATQNRSVKYTGPIDAFPAAEFVISDSPVVDPRFTHFGVNIFDGQIYITFWDTDGKIPRSTAEQLPIDWDQFATAVSRLQSALAAEKLDATLSEPIPEGTGSTFELAYELCRKQN